MPGEQQHGDGEDRAGALSEIDFTRLVIRAFGLPEPTRKTVRYDSRNRRRWLDAVWEEAGIVVEIDGIHHMDAAQWWDDMDRENGIKLEGYLVLRFTAFVVRYRPGYIAAQIREAFRTVGYSSATLSGRIATARRWRAGRSGRGRQWWGRR